MYSAEGGLSGSDLQGLAHLTERVKGMSLFELVADPEINNLINLILAEMGIERDCFDPTLPNKVMKELIRAISDLVPTVSAGAIRHIPTVSADIIDPLPTASVGTIRYKLGLILMSCSKGVDENIGYVLKSFGSLDEEKKQAVAKTNNGELVLKLIFSRHVEDFLKYFEPQRLAQIKFSKRDCGDLICELIDNVNSGLLDRELVRNLVKNPKMPLTMDIIKGLKVFCVNWGVSLDELLKNSEAYPKVGKLLEGSDNSAEIRVNDVAATIVV